MRFRVLLCLFLSALGAGTVQAQVLKLAANERLAEQFVASRLLKAIYAQAGLGLQIESMPAARASLETVQGLRDGEVARIAAYGQRNPELIRVATPYYHLTSQAFWMKSRQLAVADRGDLRRYSLGSIRGVAHSTELIKDHPAVTLTKEPLHMFRMLRAGRFDLTLDTGINGQYLIARHHWYDIESSPELARLDLIHYLHPRHAALAPRIDQSIRQLRDRGALERLRSQAEAELLLVDLDTFTGLQK